MAWYEFIGITIGALGGATGLFTLYTSGVKKESLIIDNLKQVIDEIKEHHKEYREEVNNKLNGLEKKVSEMELKDSIKQAAINKAYRCKLPEEDYTCPVIDIIDKASSIIRQDKVK